LSAEKFHIPLEGASLESGASRIEHSLSEVFPGLVLVASQSFVHGNDLHIRVRNTFQGPSTIDDPSGLKVFARYLLATLIPWNFFVLVTNMVQNSLLGYAGMVKKVAMERRVIVFLRLLLHSSNIPSKWEC
jgi:hypothetical protein